MKVYLNIIVIDIYPENFYYFFYLILQTLGLFHSISTIVGSTILLGFSFICLDLIFSLAWKTWRERKPKICLKGKHVLITGGSKGIGKEVAKEFVKRGANVSILARNSQALAEANHEISQFIINNSPSMNRQKIQDISVDITSDFDTVAKSVRYLNHKNLVRHCAH